MEGTRVRASESLEYSLTGYNVEAGPSRVADLDGGVDGGVVNPVGGFPGGHIGMRLLGMADGEPRTEVLRVMCGGGVAGRRRQRRGLFNDGGHVSMHVKSSENRCVIKSGRNVDCSVSIQGANRRWPVKALAKINNARSRERRVRVQW